MNKRMMYTMDATILIILDPIVPLRLSQRNPKMICERRGVSSDDFSLGEDVLTMGKMMMVVVVVVQSLAALAL